jgi:hypothetical protein
MNKLLMIALFLLSAVNIYAAIPVGIIPFEGDSSAAAIESKVKDALVKTDGITVVADKMMDKVVKLHESAQTVALLITIYQILRWQPILIQEACRMTNSRLKRLM